MKYHNAPRSTRVLRRACHLTAESLESRVLLSTVVVNTTQDAQYLGTGGLWSLRDAVEVADFATTPTTITFDPTVFATHKTILLTQGALPISNPSWVATITGPAAGVTIDGDQKGSVFHVESGVTADLSNLVITGGLGMPYPNGSVGGGGIYNEGTTTLTNVSITENYAGDAVSAGGGIFNDGSLTMTDFIVNGNTAFHGGGIENGGSMILTDGVINSNSDNSGAGGYAGGIENEGRLTMTNVTMTNNTSDDFGVIDAVHSLSMYNVTISGNNANTAAVYVYNTSTLTIANSVIAGNKNGSAQQDVYVEAPNGGKVTSLGYNLIGNADDSKGYWGSADLTGTAAKPLNAKLGALANNGGFSQTMLPQAGSPLIDAGENGLVPSGITTDQRGLPRIAGASVDIGAVEVQPPVNTVSGTVFSDANKNGKQDTGDAGLAGVTVYDDANNNLKPDAGEASTTTGANGAYTLSISGTGAAIVRQVLPTSYSQIAPASSGGIHLTLAGNSTFTGENFADHNNSQTVTYYTVFGTVFSDANKNAKLDSGEAGIAGVTIYNDANNNSKLDSGEASVVTAADGSYTFNFNTAGPTTGKLRQILPTGDTQTLPANNYGISITVGQTNNTNQNFGDYVSTTAGYNFTGTVFYDPNKNGKQDSGEAGLAGWEIYNDANNNNKLDTGEATAFTTSTGAYSITLTGNGSGKLRQIIPANWSQTTPANSHGITVTSSSTKTGNNFGDYTAIKYLSTVATTSGLAAWWTFDGASQANSVVNGYTGTLTGGATISSTGGAPISGESSSSGLSLNGTSAFVDTNLTTQQEFTTAATVNVWIDLGSTPAASGHVYEIAAKSQFGNDLDLQVETDGSIHFYSDTGTSDSFKPANLTGWHMLTAEYDTAAKTRKLFWDGQPVVSDTAYTGTHNPSTGAFSIGESDVFTGRYFNGKIDEVSLWNRSLTAAEVLAIYNASK